jgi:3-oxoacyl-[acyl-carrier protein] reductase
LDLQGKVAVVTGSSVGLGREVALGFAREGARVVINYSKSEAEAEQTLADTKALGAEAIVVKGDMANEPDVKYLMAAAASEFGGIDILVNNAARTYFVAAKKLDDVTEQMWDDIFHLNVRGVFLCCREAANYMNDPSHIVNIGSTAGVDGNGSSIPYAASKGALHNMTIALARALAPKTRVNCIAPGFMETRWLKGGFGDRYESIRDDVAARTPLAHAAAAAEVADMVIALARGGDFVTGQTLVVDGGSIIAR